MTKPKYPLLPRNCIICGETFIPCKHTQIICKKISCKGKRKKRLQNKYLDGSEYIRREPFENKKEYKEEYIIKCSDEKCCNLVYSDKPRLCPACLGFDGFDKTLYPTFTQLFLYFK